VEERAGDGAWNARIEFHELKDRSVKDAAFRLKGYNSATDAGHIRLHTAQCGRGRFLILQFKTAFTP
jgi:hypothetical protein